MGVPGLDEVAAVIDKHTGRVHARFEGFGAGADARSFLRATQSPSPGNTKVDHLSSATVIYGDKAKKAIKTGRV